MKNLYVDEVNRILKVLDKYDLNNDIDKLSNISGNMKEFKVKILLVGGFSAGKSALINTLLNRDLLSEGQKPETTIASEIVYDNEEYVEAVHKSGIEKYKIGQIDSIDPEKYEYLVYHINNDILSKIREYTLVDMPGFNSGIKNHNKAILRYVGFANAYILVIDCEDGGIKTSMNDFIREIKNYENNMAIAVTKTDLKTPDDVEAIKENIADTASMLFERDINIISVSKIETGADNKIISIIKTFDTEGIFKQTYKPQICEICLSAVNALECLKKNFKLNTSGLKNEIEKRKQAKQSLLNKFEDEKRNLQIRFSNDVKPNILSDVQNALLANADSLVSSAKAGGTAFSSSVNNIIRPILINSTQKYTEQNFSEFISNFEVNVKSENYDLSEMCGDILSKLVENSTKTPLEKYGKYDAIYKIATTTLALSTTIIAPVLEGLLIFLPDILKLFFSKNKETGEEDIKAKITGEIIPQICAKLSPEIDRSLSEIKGKLMDQLEEKLSAMIDAENDALESAVKAKESMEQEYDEKLKSIDEDISEITTVIEIM